MATRLSHRHWQRGGGDPFFSCTVLECSCAFSAEWGSDDFWAAETNPEDPDEAFAVGNYNFQIHPDWPKYSTHNVIAVRGGRGG